MNATKLYTQLSRKVMLLNKDSDDAFLGEFMRSDMGFLKLRALLLCRSCRELCLEPFSSEFCHHLRCKQCLDEKKIHHPSCKWCRNSDDLVADIQSKILIASYKKLCAILREFVTGYINDKSGLSPTKSKLMRFLNEGCSLPDISSQDSNKSKEKRESVKYIETISKGVQADIVATEEEKVTICPPCCCTCENVETNVLKKDQSYNVVQVTTAESSGIANNDEKLNASPEYRSDTVSSTVPDTAPVNSITLPDAVVENKYGDVENEGLSSGESCNIKIEPSPDYGEHLKNNNLEENAVISCEFYDSLSSISQKERQNRSIFEKFGLALSPTPSKLDHAPTGLIKRVEKHRRKKHSKDAIHKERKKKEGRDVKQKVQPLKLKVRKVNSYNSDSGYSVQYNISHGIEKNDEIDLDSDDILNSKDGDHPSNHTDSPEPQIRKVKRKATFISNYAIFSDDSDFEADYFDSKRSQKVSNKKDKPEACTCGSGNHVKYFTNICKRARCPCFSQGRACTNCKCKFCSNPYLMNHQGDGMFTDSDSAHEPTPITYWVKDETEVIDVEAM